MILYILYRIGIFFALALPVRASYFMACRLADAYCLLSPSDRAAVIGNMRVVTGGSKSDGELSAMARGVFRNFAKYLVDFFRQSRIDADYIKKFVKVEGREHVDEALTRGKGVIMLSAHIGNWELGGAIVAMLGYPLSAVVLAHGNKKINGLFRGQRLISSMVPIEIGASLKECYRVLKANKCLALMGDRDFTKNGLTSELFGKNARIPRGPAVFAYRLASAVVPAFMVREADDTFRLVFEEPLFADASKDEASSVEELMKRYVAVMEAYIRKYPTQWYAFKSIWERDAEEDMRPDTII